MSQKHNTKLNCDIHDCVTYAGKNGKAIIVVVEDTFKGVSKCHPMDDFNEEIGYKIAYSKAMLKQAKAIINDAEKHYSKKIAELKAQRSKTVISQRNIIKHFENQIEYYSYLGNKNTDLDNTEEIETPF